MATTTPRKGRRRRTLALGLAVLLLGGVGAAYLHFTSPERIRALVEAQLQRYAGGLVTVGRAEFSLFHGTTLYDVVVASPEPETGAPLPPLFECRRIEATHSPWGALLGRPHINALLAISPKCTIVHDERERRTNLSSVMNRITSSGSATVRSLPLIELREAQVRVMSRRGEHVRPVQDWQLTVRGKASTKDDAIYDIVWHATDAVDGERAGGHSQLDLRSGTARNVDGGLPRMSLETVMLAVNASVDDIGAWADLIGIDGDVRVTDYSLSAPRSAATQSPTPERSATVELSNASLSLPVSDEEAALPRARRYVQFTDVNGTATVTAERIVADFVGSFHGSRCHVHGTIPLPIRSRRVRDFGFDLSLSLVGLELPRPDRAGHDDEARAIRAWPAVAAVYDRYDPSGKADVDLELFRRSDQPGPPHVRRLRITPRGASAQFNKFPYRVDHVTGAVEVTGNGGTLESLKCDHHGAGITVDGKFGKRGGCDPVAIHIVGVGIPLDDDLSAAITPAQRDTWKMFAPVGTVDLDVHVAKSACMPETPATWSTTTTARFDDLSARVRAFPYPLQHLRGSIEFTHDAIAIQDIVSQAGDTRLQGSGMISLDHSRARRIRLQIDGTHLPFDDALLDSLPPSVRTAVAAFHPTGHFDFSTLLSKNQNADKLRHETEITIRRGTLQHDDLPVLITDVKASLHTTPEETVVESLSGRIDGAPIQASGRIDHASGRFAGTLTAQNLRPTPGFIAALPQPWRNELQAISIDGGIDVSVRIPPAGEPTADDRPTVTINFNGADVTLPQFPVPIERVRGELVVDAAGARASKLTGHFGQADVTANITLDFDGTQRQANISANVRGLVLDDVRALLPNQLQAMWDRLKPSGSVDLSVDKLRYTNPGHGAAPTWHSAGQARLRNVSIAGVGGIDRATGVVSFDGTLRDRLGGVVLDGKLDLVGLRIEERKLTQITADWSLLRAADDTGRLAFDRISADLYGGAATASLNVMLEPDTTRYELSAKLKSVDLAPLLGATRAGADTTNDAPQLRGITDAQLDVSGILGNPRTRRGRASLAISKGRIYRVPVVFAMSQVLNLSVPNRDTFDSLSASGFIDGDEIIIRDARIAGKEMALIGQGTVTLPSLATDFYFVSVNPNRWSRIPVLTDVIDRASRELVGLSVGGTLHDPVVQPRAFRDVADELERLFVPRKPKNNRAVER